MLDGDETPAQTLGPASQAVVVVAAPVLSTEGPVAAVTVDGLAGAAGAQLLRQTHGVEPALFSAAL